jgi:rhodanese-related sulfurtransferase
MASDDTSPVTSISPAEVMALLSSHPDRVLLLDVRPNSDYVVGHVKNALSVRLSSILLRRLGLNKTKIESVLSEPHRVKYRAVMEADPIVTVVYDARTETVDMTNIDKKNPLHVVLGNLAANGLEPRYMTGSCLWVCVHAFACMCSSRVCFKGATTKSVRRTISVSQRTSIVLATTRSPSAPSPLACLPWTT